MASRIGEHARVLAAAVLAKLVLYGCLFASSAIFDTSSSLLFNHHHLIHPTWENSGSTSWASKLATRVVAWDALYFVGMAEKWGPSFEHEYAFSSYWAKLIGVLSSAHAQTNPVDVLTRLALTAAGVSFVSHLVACVFITEFARHKALSKHVDPVSVGMIYGVSPAGIYMVSGYTESSCAALTFVGLWLFYRKRAYVLAGAAFGGATLLRSNGLLWGVCFALGLASELLRARVRWIQASRLIIGGAIVGLSFAWPQLEAYMLYCHLGSLPERPEWCDATIPSIYTYVQDKYWNNGFLRYWTISNIPLFLLAGPVLYIVGRSTLFLKTRGLWAPALVQLVVLTGLLFFWHVQIVMRISSSLPGPALYLGALLKQRPVTAKCWVAGFIVWACTQAALYGAFLPPA